MDHPTTEVFDRQRFEEWIDEQNGHILVEELESEFPNFPFHLLHGVTVLYSEDGMAYYQHDVRRAARGDRARD